jgi:CDP-2,3-bis-(O-geranylgeranyl)-sn-glycerol synthase
MSIHWLSDLQALLLLTGANTAPVLSAGLLGPRLAAPIDRNVTFRDGRPIFGPHKTWRGLVCGIVAAAALAAATGLAAAMGAAFGALGLLGDLFSSFVKRRWGKASGTWMPLVDQLPEALLPLLFAMPWLSLDWTDVAQAYRDARGPLSLASRTTVIIDDGLATGATMVAAVRAARVVRRLSPDRR